MSEFLCWLGFHDWKRVAPLNQQPTRYCINCKKTQGLFRGAGGDDWIDDERDIVVRQETGQMGYVFRMGPTYHISRDRKTQPDDCAILESLEVGSQIIVDDGDDGKWRCEIEKVFWHAIATDELIVIANKI